MAIDNRVRVSRISVTLQNHYCIRVSRITASTAAAPAGANNRIRVSRITAGQAASGLVPTNRVRVSRISARTWGTSYIYLFDGTRLVPLEIYLFDGTTLSYIQIP